MKMGGVSRQSRLRGVLLGTAVGDALGLPAEGLSRRRAARLFHKPWRHSLLAGRGMISDDTEQTVFVAQALLAHPDSVDAFARRLAWSLRWWFVSLPAGIGFGTLRSIIRLWLGVPPARSGVRSAGNGAAMRVAPIGAVFWRDPGKLSAYVKASTRLTHSDPRALTGATVIATLCAWCFQNDGANRPSGDELVRLLRRPRGEDDAEWADIVDGFAEALTLRWSVQRYADSLGLARGVSGYVYHTVPVAVYAWYRHFGDFEAALTSVLDCGGDTDTAGAIVGAISGALVGEEGIPRRWIDGIADWPRGTPLFYQLADRLFSASEAGRPLPVVKYFWPAVILRNLVFMMIVLVHGLRRLAPPY